LITHDLGVVAEMCERVAVMYAGEIVEQTDVGTLFDTPFHPYTQGIDRLDPYPWQAQRSPGSDPWLCAKPGGLAARLPFCSSL
jgi:peptide/nickel transport system ATP-binding protein